jgi:hypothetical protein
MNRAPHFLLLFTAFLILARPCASQSKDSSTDVPRFEDFPVKNIFHGKPALPILTGNNRYYRTRYREQAALGPDFAGHYKIVIWGCGSNCDVASIVDEQTGRIYEPFPFELNVPVRAADGSQYQGFNRRLDSSLLIVGGCPETGSVDDPRTDKCFTTYYKWQNHRLISLKRISTPQPSEKPSTR